MPKLSRSDRERIRREKARRFTTDYCCYIDPKAGWGQDPFITNHYRAQHLAYLGTKLDAIIRGDIKRLMVFMPNRHWKSSLCTMKFPSLFIGRRYSEGLPHQVMLISHTSDKSEEFSSATRNLIRDTDGRGRSLYRHLFPDIHFSKTRQGAKEWGLMQKDNPHLEESFPTMTTGSMLSPPTGSGADLLIIDDPVKNSKDARSPSVQKAHWDTWTEGLRTRLNSLEESAVLLIMTRWNVNDIAGQLLRKAAEDPLADQWEVVVLPALAYTSKERSAARRAGIPAPDVDPLGREPGEALWPEKFRRIDHLGTKANAPSAFSSIGQQMPIKEGGNLVGRENFRIIPSLTPEEAAQVEWVICIDAAYKQKQLAKDDPDFNVVGLLGIRKTETQQIDIILGGLVRTQMGIDAAKKIIPAFAQAVGKKLGKTIPIYGDGATLDRILLDDVRNNQNMLRWSVQSLSNPRLKKEFGSFSGDKVEKSEAWRSRAVAGNFFLVAEDWLSHELTKAFKGQMEALFGDEPLAWHEKYFTEVEAFPDGTHDDMVDMTSTGYHPLSGGNEEGVDVLPFSLFDIDAAALKRHQQRPAVTP